MSRASSPDAHWSAHSGCSQRFPFPVHHGYTTTRNRHQMSSSGCGRVSRNILVDVDVGVTLIVRVHVAMLPSRLGGDRGEWCLSNVLSSLWSVSQFLDLVDFTKLTTRPSRLPAIPQALPPSQAIVNHPCLPFLMLFHLSSTSGLVHLDSGAWRGNQRASLGGAIVAMRTTPRDLPIFRCIGSALCLICCFFRTILTTT